jgi:3-deoxy-manno-octulosonate cytidylyltransferase (CMP-KDO synthetase)
MTSPDHECGTDRIAEAAKSLDADLIINIQADEPEISGDAIDKAIELLIDRPSLDVSTLATPLRDKSRLNDPSCVKVVFDADQNAMYFSRSPIPFPRQWSDDLMAESPANFFQHVGLYGYRREFLGQISSLPRPRIEQLESLEQLRFLHAGFSIGVAVIDQALRGIDTYEDYAAFVQQRSK